MMDLISSRATVENLLEVVKTKPTDEARSALWDALQDQRQTGGAESALLASALAVLHGKPVKIPGRLLGSLPLRGGLVVTVHGSDLEVAAVSSLAGTALADLLAATAERLEAPTAPQGDVAPANLEEANAPAANRIAHSVQTHLRRHYEGEITHRGRLFLTQVFIELLGLALGAELATADPEVVTARLEDITGELPVRVAYYQAHVEQKLDAQAPEPGEQPPAGDITRLH